MKGWRGVRIAAFVLTAATAVNVVQADDALGSFSLFFSAEERQRKQSDLAEHDQRQRKSDDRSSPNAGMRSAAPVPQRVRAPERSQGESSRNDVGSPAAKQIEGSPSVPAFRFSGWLERDGQLTLFVSGMYCNAINGAEFHKADPAAGRLRQAEEDINTRPAFTCRADSLSNTPELALQLDMDRQQLIQETPKQVYRIQPGEAVHLP